MAKVLIVDDAIVVRMVLDQCVKKAGHQVVGLADTGQGALDTCRQQLPDVVILDLGLPDQDGLEVLKEIKKCHPRARVIVYSAQNMPEVPAMVKAAGGDAFLHKPITPDKLTKILKEMVEVTA